MPETHKRYRLLYSLRPPAARTTLADRHEGFVEHSLVSPPTLVWLGMDRKLSCDVSRRTLAGCSAWSRRSRVVGYATSSAVPCYVHTTARGDVPQLLWLSVVSG